MKSIIKNIPFHAFLLVPALIFFLFAYNYYTTTFKSTIRSYEIAIIFSAMIFFISYVLNKQKHKAGVVTTALMLALFFYGFIYELAEKLYYKGLWPFSEIHRYLLLIIFLFATLLCYFLFRTKRTFQSLTYAFNVFVIILFLLNFIRLFVSIAKAENTTLIDATPTNVLPIQKKDSLPDIYYIILDGYAHDSILSEIYHCKKNNLTDYLSKNKFFVAQNSRTNYISTSPALSSSLNYSYLDSNEQKNIIYNNKVSAYLKNKGYGIVHVRSGFAVTRENNNADTIIALENLSEFERTLLRYSIFRLDDLLGYARYKTLKEQLSVIYNVLNVKGPKYVFIHIVSPHPPYVCDENGNFKSSPRVINAWWEPK